MKNDDAVFKIIPTPRKSFYTLIGKRIIDFTLSLIAIVILSPLLALVSILEIMFHGTPVLFVTNRPGKNGKSFTMYKFRSMTNKCDENGIPLPDNQRLTKFGAFIRKTSIDELPALFSILKGDMSIIGPRPLLSEYLPLYGNRYEKRHSVLPGLECPIIDKNKQPDTLQGTWREQFENDVYYIENCSFLLDCRMLIAVVAEVFAASSRRANNTRVPFDGSNFDETRSKEELGIASQFASINNSVKTDQQR